MLAAALTPSPLPAFGRERNEEENEGAGLAPSLLPPANVKGKGEAMLI
jgi:hypothetical protein